MQALGHEVIVSAFYGLNGAVLHLDGVTVLPGSKDAYGNDMLLAHKQFYDADLVVGLLDIWVLNPQMLHLMDCFYGWSPVDHDPIPPVVVKGIEASRGVIAYSKFGKSQMEAAGFKPHYVPHGVETSVFKPIDQDEARKTINAPKDMFIVGMVLANKGAPSRKAFDQQIRAFAKIRERHNDALLYLHTDMRGIQGENLGRIIELAGLPKASVAVAPQYELQNGMLNADHMNSVYNACDVIMNATRGEGFGIPIVEAQAAGTPVIVTNFSSMPELCFGGWTVDYVDKVYTGQESYQVIPDVRDIERSLEKAYKKWQKGKLDDLGERARAGALAYDADTVTQEYWKPVLQAIEYELFPERKPQPEPIRITSGRDLTLTIDGIGLQVRENANGGTAREAAVEVIDQYGLDKLDLKSGDKVLDIGANVGVISMYLAKKYPGVQVYAYEPVSETYSYLQHNLSANRIENVTPVRKAVNGRNGRVMLYGDTTANAGGVSVQPVKEYLETVETTTLNDILDEHKIDRVALLKFDCELSEYDLFGDGSVLSKVDRVRGEVHTVAGANGRYDPSALTALIEGNVKDAKLVTFELDPFVLQPDVSVIIPTLNGARTIRRALDAALCQSVETQVIVIDDGSTDDTPQVLATYDDKIQVITHDTNVGQVPAMNAGLAAATGKYVLFHGDDDWLEVPDGLRPLVEALDDAPLDVAFAYGDLQYHGGRTDLSPALPYNEGAFYRAFLAQTGVIWRRELAVKHNLQYRTLHDGKTGHCEDYDMILQLIEAGYKGVAVNKLIIHYTLAPKRATAWVHANQDKVLPAFKARHPKFVGRL